MAAYLRALADSPETPQSLEATVLANGTITTEAGREHVTFSKPKREPKQSGPRSAVVSLLTESGIDLSPYTQRLIDADIIKQPHKAVSSAVLTAARVFFGHPKGSKQSDTDILEIGKLLFASDADPELAQQMAKCLLPNKYSTTRERLAIMHGINPKE